MTYSEEAERDGADEFGECDQREPHVDAGVEFHARETGCVWLSWSFKGRRSGVVDVVA